jgi:hypothetical protein
MGKKSISPNKFRHHLCGKCDEIIGIMQEYMKVRKTEFQCLAVLSYIADLKNYIIHQPVASKDDLKWVSVNDRMPDIEDYNYMEIDGKIKICSDNFALVVVSMDNESSGRMGYDISAGELCTDCEGKPYFKILDPELRDSYRVVGWMHLPEVNVEKLMGIEN